MVRRRVPLPTYPFERERYSVDYSARPETSTSAEAPVQVIMHARPEVQSAFAAPQSEREIAIARIWERCLGIDRIGVNDNFFELGGDSLLAGQVIAEIEKELHIELHMILFFAAPTIALLVPLLDPSVDEPTPSSPGEAPVPGRKMNSQRLRRQEARRTID